MKIRMLALIILVVFMTAGCAAKIHHDENPRPITVTCLVTDEDGGGTATLTYDNGLACWFAVENCELWAQTRPLKIPPQIDCVITVKW